mmetsp:Transcript_20099/g.76966  ORF Transcript_20099/g.76966 Transcript_20099/m.76966 type:complete len:272 (-) Transcript_20099:345-1160(-)
MRAVCCARDSGTGLFCTFSVRSSVLASGCGLGSTNALEEADSCGSACVTSLATCASVALLASLASCSAAWSRRARSFSFSRTSAIMSFSSIALSAEKSTEVSEKSSSDPRLHRSPSMRDSVDSSTTVSWLSTSCGAGLCSASMSSRQIDGSTTDDCGSTSENRWYWKPLRARASLVAGLSAKPRPDCSISFTTVGSMSCTIVSNVGFWIASFTSEPISSCTFGWFSNSAVSSTALGQENRMRRGLPACSSPTAVLKSSSVLKVTHSPSSST